MAFLPFSISSSISKTYDDFSIQVEALKQMLNFNDVGGGSAGNRGGDSFYGSGSGESALMSSEPKWKVLVYDAVGQAILAPIFSVKQLRDSGVTLHILIDSQRYDHPKT